jgi:hypothetical protein
MALAAATVVLMAALGLLRFSDFAGAIPPGTSQIRMVGRLESKEDNARTFGLYSASYKGRIGTEVLACGSQKTWRICLDFIRTPRGTLIAQGIVPVSSRFIVLGVLGGTGIYSNTGGTLTLVTRAESQQQIVGNLEGF